MLLLAFAGGLSAQVTVEVLLDQDQFLPNESLPAKVRIVNNSGQTLRFGSEDWLNYSVEAKDGFIVLKNGDAPLAHNFEVKAGEMATARADLSPCFDISKPGRYSVTATINIKDWEAQVSSAPKNFDVVRGVKLWEQEFGVPQSPDDHSQPEVRKYILQQATLSRHVELFLRLTDAAGERVAPGFFHRPDDFLSATRKRRVDQRVICTSSIRRGRMFILTAWSIPPANSPRARHISTRVPPRTCGWMTRGKSSS